MVAFITSPIDTLLQGATRARAPGRTCTVVPTLPCKPNSRCDLRETKLAPNTRWGSRSRDPIGYLDSRNLFQGLLSSPTTSVDPSGLQCVPNWTDDGTCTIAKFLAWIAKERAELATWISKIEPCPCSLACTVKFECNKCSSNGVKRKINHTQKYRSCPYLPRGWAFEGTDILGYHPDPNRQIGIRTTNCESGTCTPGNQCSYDRNGNLITSPPGAGSADRYAGFCPGRWDDWRSWFGTLNPLHMLGDVKPFDCAVELQKELGIPAIAFYYTVRPVVKKCSNTPFSLFEYSCKPLEDNAYNSPKVPEIDHEK